jgi:hypothetical protein
MCTVLRPLVDEFDDIVLIMYNHDITEFIVTNANVDDVIQQLRKWSARGATNFTKVFNRISQLLSTRMHKHNFKIDFRVSFFTDGQHYTGDYGGIHTTEADHNRMHAVSTQEMYDALNAMKYVMQDRKISAAGGNTTIVCRAYGGNNDVGVMKVITSAGITTGNYKYASTASDIKKIMCNDDMLTCERITSTICINTGTSIINTSVNMHAIECRDNDIPYSHEGGLFIKSNFLAGAIMKFARLPRTLLLWRHQVQLSRILLND